MNLSELFYEILIVEDRWMLIVNGLLATIVITLLVLIGPSALVARISPTKAIQSE